MTLYVLELFPQNRGLAASLQGFIQTLMFAGISSLVVPLVLGSGLRRAGVLCAMLTLNYAGWRFFHRSAPKLEPLPGVSSEVG